ncbi:MAG: thioredoxin family protein [Sphingomonadales bacterium]|nr:thioredoxin family protein [Sphingomonadales bacterium]MDE2568985.1 thioredoxin family protein [Sphingomonadales bacterium]
MGNPLNFVARAALRWLAVLSAALTLGAMPALAEADPGQPHLVAQLLLASAAPAPGSTVDAALAVDPGAGWHIYWQNPGDSGYAPRVSWNLPKGYALSPLVHPAPVRINVGGIAMNVHIGRTLLLTRLTVPAGAHAGDSVTIRGEGDFLVCSQDLCVPRAIKLERALTVGSGAVDRAVADEISSARRSVPQELAGDVPFRVLPHGISLTLPAGLPLGTHGRLAVFSARPDEGTLGPVEQVGEAGGGSIEISAARGTLADGPDHDFVAVLTTAGSAPRAWRFHAVLAPVAAAAPGGAASHDAFLALGAIGGAILGGLLLNLMPCVFPILSLKAMSLLRAGASEREARLEAVGYLLGAVGVMVALGAAVLALRAGGEAVGWAFQLQDARVVAILLLLVTAISANLAGLFEIPALPGAGLGRAGFVGGIGTGALAAFIATPCTGPFMAGALGTALVLPALAAMGVFAGLGLGLALPFLVIAFWEPARRWLPRPGGWMATVRRLLSLPMFATALALAWLLGKQAGVDAMTRGLAAAFLLGAALWWWGLRQRSERHGWPVALVAAGALALGGAVPYQAEGTATTAASDGSVVAYSPPRLAELRRQHRSVLVYATASWCLTCKVNEASSLSPARVRDAFARAGAVMMEADWTRNDPAVTRLLSDNGRAGVPLYLFYPTSGQPRILPQILTPDLVIGLLAPPRRT